MRNLIVFLGGLIGCLHEAFLANTERPTLLILYAAMMGLPAMWREHAAPVVQAVTTEVQMLLAFLEAKRERYSAMEDPDWAQYEAEIEPALEKLIESGQ